MKPLIVLLAFICSFSSFSQSAKKVKETKIYSMNIDQKPEFPGGAENLVSYIRKNLVEAGFQKELTSKISAIFIVEKDGSISDIQVLNAPNDALKDAMTIILSTAPKWSAGKHKGATVRVKSSIVLAEVKKLRTLELVGPMLD